MTLLAELTPDEIAVIVATIDALTNPSPSTLELAERLAGLTDTNPTR